MVELAGLDGFSVDIYSLRNNFLFGDIMKGFVEFCIFYGIPILALLMAVRNFYRYFKFERPISELYVGISFCLASFYLISHQPVFAYFSLGALLLCLLYSLIFDRSCFTRKDPKGVQKIMLITLPILFIGGYALYVMI
jgi:hypothetical protein